MANEDTPPTEWTRQTIEDYLQACREPRTYSTVAPTWAEVLEEAASSLDSLDALAKALNYDLEQPNREKYTFDRVMFGEAQHWEEFADTKAFLRFCARVGITGMYRDRISDLCGRLER